MDVRDKGIFVTGAAMGIGLALIEGLLQRGAKVLFCDINESKGREAEEDLRKQYTSSDVIFVHCDVTDGDQLKESFDRAVSRFGAVELYVNNVGIMDESNWEKVIAINQNSPDNAAHGVRWGAVLPDACFTALNRWDKEGQVFVKMEERIARDTTHWLTPKEASYAFFTLLEDPDSNGGMLKIFKKGGQLYQELLMMDKSTTPVTSLYTKYTKVQIADQ